MSKKNHKLYDEIQRLRRQLAELKEPSGMHFEAKEFIVVATSTLFAFAGMLAENEVVLYFCLVIPCLAYLYLCLKHEGSKLRRSVVALIVVSLFGLMVFLVHRRGLNKEQDDVKSKLSAQAFIPSNRNVLRTGISVINGGGTALTEHSIQCILRRVVYAPYGGISGIGMQTTLPQKSILRAFGDGETSYCMAGIQSFPPDTHPICADLTVAVSYVLETQPSVRDTKPFRFVASGDDFVYRQQPVDYPGDYCPEPRLPPQPLVH
jgi:hypothetical protein